MHRYLTILLVNLVLAAKLLAQGIILPPTNLTAQPVPGSHPRVYLSWQNAPGTWYCNVYRSMYDTLHFVRIASVPGHSYEDRGVMSGRTYYYYLRAVAWGDSSVLESPSSNMVVAVLNNTGGPYGTLRGTVVDDSTGMPLRNVRVRFFRVATNWSGQYDITDSLGAYEATIDTGRYLIKAEPPCEPGSLPQYRPEWYNNAPEPSSATIVTVTVGGTFTANFGLQRVYAFRHAEISGTVRNEQGQPLSGATVAVMRSLHEMQQLAATTGTIPGLGNEERQLPGIGYARGVIWSGSTDQQGRFRAVVPAGGSYIVASGKQGFFLQYFNQTTDPTRATVVTASEDTSGVNFFLRAITPTPNTINGTVRDTTGDPVPSRVILFPRPINGQPPTQIVHSGVGGEYTFAHVEDGSYTILALPYSNYGAAFYRQGAYGVSQWQLADSVVVSSSQATAHVGVLPILSNGLVTASGVARSSTGEPLVGARILVRNALGGLVGTGVSSLSGAFSIDALPFGDVTFLVDREPFNPQVVPVAIPPNTYSILNINVVLTRVSTTEATEAFEAPNTFSLEQNYPNPFNPSTIIRFDVRNNGLVSLKVFDVVGREVATLVHEPLKPGRYEIRWDANGAAGGVYYYRLEAGQDVAVRKMILIR